MKEKKDNKSEIVKTTPTNKTTAEKEEEVLRFWQENKIFEKTIEKDAPNGNFVFYDGPPFATGTPHFGHLLPSGLKDAIPRYQTMQGKRVLRKWGWDCHGLPLENIIEKELNLSTKKDILEYGLNNFNQRAREAVLRYADHWKNMIDRVGRFVDMENDYKTMDKTYTESVWWSFKELHSKGLVYRGFKSMHLCPRCETTLSNFEVNQGYKDITDISVYVKFELIDEPNTFLLAWTTTPWTLPGNVALAVGENIDYVKVVNDAGEKYILAKHRFEDVLKENFKILESIGSSKIIGKKYKPIFDYYSSDEKLENKEKGWKVYGADFVTTDTGTGIVHIAPAFGEDDYNLAQKYDLPFIQHISMDGKMKEEVKDFALMPVKPKSDEKDGHQKTDIEIIKYLAHKNTLFAKEKIVHSYPHCWRCDTPLLNYATSSWFVGVSKIKNRMLEENSKVNWIPKEIGENRFGNWIEGAKDWAISRSRFWGAPIPVWQDEEGKNHIFGSLLELKERIVKKNNYFLMRHGRSVSNEKNIISCLAGGTGDLLTKEGVLDAKKASEFLKDKKIDVIIYSPFNRTTETVNIVKDEIGFSGESFTDNRLIELQANHYNGNSWTSYLDNFPSIKDRFTNKLNDNENWLDVYRRSANFICEIDSKYENKNILIVSHGSVLCNLSLVSSGFAKEELHKRYVDEMFKNAEVREVDFRQLPINADFEIDLHRPFIDDIKVFDENGKIMKRVEDVFDCWYESGSMFFAQQHYPFENKELFEQKNSPIFPADFIAEGLDQTRGWFYTLLVLGTALFEKSPYKNVIVNGLVLAEDGKKMSKKLKNYPDLMETINKYGVDAIRFFLLSSPAVKADDFSFSPKGVDEIYKKIVLKLENIYSFYEMYKSDDADNLSEGEKSENVLDDWIINKLSVLINDITRSMDKYEVDKATKPILDFVEDFSTWYIRRSRDRFKSENIVDKNSALSTTRFALLSLAKVVAPFMPFLGERIYLSVKNKDDFDSVHLCSWPKSLEISKEGVQNMEDMAEARKIVSLALEKRNKFNIKVRQVLNELKIKNRKLLNKYDYLKLIEDEINVKKVVFDENLDEEIWLDSEITEDLRREGIARDLIRTIQDLRKQNGLYPNQAISLTVDTDENGKELFMSFERLIVGITNIDNVVFEKNDSDSIVFEGMSFKLKIKICV